MPETHLKVVTKKDGFRRAGRAWSGSSVVPRADFTPEQIAALQADPNFILDETAAPADDKPPARAAKS